MCICVTCIAKVFSRRIKSKQKDSREGVAVQHLLGCLLYFRDTFHMFWNCFSIRSMGFRSRKIAIMPARIGTVITSHMTGV